MVMPGKLTGIHIIMLTKLKMSTMTIYICTVHHGNIMTIPPGSLKLENSGYPQIKSA